MSEVKVRLGRHLFYDKRLSANGSQSCGTCHRQELAFTDGKPAATGSTGQAHPRSSMSLVNIAYDAVLTWANPNLHSLEKQALIPMFSVSPVELGLGGAKSGFIRTLRADEVYRRLFPQSFPGERDPYTVANVTKAIAAFERTIISARSPYDRYHYGGDGTAISDSAKRGEVLFFTEPVAACYRCHDGFNLGGTGYHNTGLYNLPGVLSYPSTNPGIFEHTKRAADVGKFKAPALRNIALTAPYMHDGSVSTLEQVLDHYAAGGRTIIEGPNAGVGNDNPNKDPRIKKLFLTRQNREDLLAFLRSLTDEELIHDPRFADPW